MLTCLRNQIMRDKLHFYQKEDIFYLHTAYIMTIIQIITDKCLANNIP
jgi:hypothetical protein